MVSSNDKAPDYKFPEIKYSDFKTNLNKGIAWANLSKEVFHRSAYCVDSIKDELKYDNENDKNIKWTNVLFEFIYFFMHMTNRIAYSVLGDEKRVKLQKELGPVIIESTIETIIGHWPQDIEQGSQTQFIARHGYVPHGAVMHQCKHKSDTQFINTLGNLFR